MDYAVRGPIPQRAAELKKTGRKIISCNIGNPQALGQPPLSFYRQVLSILEYPELVEIYKGNSLSHSPETAIEYAEYIQGEMDTGLGAYSDSKGHLFIREAVAQFIDRRDNTLERKGVLS